MIGRITTSGTFTEFPIPTSDTKPVGIAAGPDGALWFTQELGNSIGRITTTGTVTEFALATANSFPRFITAGPDGALWFTELRSNKIGRITTAGVITEFTVPTASSRPWGITTGPDGALWFTEINGNKIGRITTGALAPASNIAVTGNQGGPFSPPIVNYSLTGTGNYTVTGMPDWLNASSAAGTIGGAGTTISFSVNGAANAKAAGTYGPTTITFTNTTASQTFTRTATLTVGAASTLTTVLSAVLPASRSVQVGTTATAFATIINTGGVAGTNCGMSLGNTAAASFSFQTTDPATNALTGTGNTPINIPAGAAQSYVFAITPSAAFSATDVPVTAGCTNSAPAPTVVGLNTLLLSASATPVPDIVALAATTSNDGIVTIPGSTGAGAFAVASVNVGIGSAITVSADTGAATLPVLLTLCQTNPGNGQCTSAIGATVATTIAANATPTFRSS